MWPATAGNGATAIETFPRHACVNLRSSTTVSTSIRGYRAGEHGATIERPHMTISRRAWRTLSVTLAGVAIALGLVSVPVVGAVPQPRVDDVAHQYFGESFLAADVHLAPHAAVVLLHLCYAAGNSEIGFPEPSLVVATQRVDNYAAGWLRAGADAVIADTFGPPEPYV